jgi:tRNA(His) guanylyltransferase
MNNKQSLGDRMKLYESINKKFLIPNIPVIIRLDGKAFHSFTKRMNKPFDEVLIRTMDETAKYLCENIMGCKIAYVQSDEITLLLTDFDSIETQMWFNGNIQKIVSVSASMATMAFNKILNFYVSKEKDETDKTTIYDKAVKTGAMFDSRVFQLPVYEVINNFIWRQQDATRNSIQLVGQSKFSHKELHKKSCNDIQDMLIKQKNINWNDFPTNQKRGRCVRKEKHMNNDAERCRWIVDNEIPIFTNDREYINELM